MANIIAANSEHVKIKLDNGSEISVPRVNFPFEPIVGTPVEVQMLNDQMVIKPSTSPSASTYSVNPVSLETFNQSNGTNDSTSTAPATGFVAQPQPAQFVYYRKQTGFPVVDAWVVDSGRTALGIIIAFIVSAVFSYHQSALTTSLWNDWGRLGVLPFYFIFGVTVLVLGAFQIWYALVVYPSLFSDNPKLRDNGRISLLNGLLGGLIFGLLFNHNLTRGQKGISYIIYACISALSELTVLFALFSIF
ncbi:MAG: hypothetical protein LBC43_04385 [Bifidobacteriaceae bacterium]|jgi:hypothetical protein|nr:hypothetical protein [Bifidobacteriaceae bacterium]